MGTTQTQTVERTLRAFALLEGIPEPELKALEARCRWRICDKGQTVLDKGATSRDVFFVLRGSVAVVTFSPSGKEVTLATVKPGESFGELAAIDEQPRSASTELPETTEARALDPDSQEPVGEAEQQSQEAKKVLCRLELLGNDLVEGGELLGPLLATDVVTDVLGLA